MSIASNSFDSDRAIKEPGLLLVPDPWAMTSAGDSVIFSIPTLAQTSIAYRAVW